MKEKIGGKENIAGLPTLDAVDALRLAKNKKEIDEEDYAALKENVLEKGKDAREVKKDLTELIRQRREIDDPETARKKRKEMTLRRLIGVLKALKEEIRVAKIAPVQIVKDAEGLIKKLEQELG